MGVKVVVVGAGPYALSLAAHLRARGVEHQVVGRCMDAWLRHMPEAMVLKSEAFASDLFAPGAGYRLEEYCRERGLAYEPIGYPVPRRVFAAYGREFQRRFVPELREEHVARIERAVAGDASGVRPGARSGGASGAGFRVTTESGWSVVAERVVLAVGLHPFPYIPAAMRGLSAASHSFDHGDVSGFAGRRVMVWGAGASAINLAIDLKDHGAEVEVVARAGRIVFHDAPVVRRGLRERVRNPRSALGLGWRSWLAAELPGVFRRLPVELRHRVVARHLGPAPNWTTRAEFEGRIPARLGLEVERMAEGENGVEVWCRAATGERQVLRYDHVIAATGFRPMVERMTMLEPGLAGSLATEMGAVKLDGNFESSERGLYFVGLAAANTFGPLFRFACGAKYASRRLSRHLAR